MSVFLPATSRFRQSAAQALGLPGFAVAFGGQGRSFGRRFGAGIGPRPSLPNRFPSPNCRPGVSTVGPGFCHRQSLAYGRIGGFFPFYPVANALSSRSIKTLTRGSLSCSTPNFLQPFWSPQPCLAACQRPHSAALPVPLSARPLPMPPMKTWLPAPPLARLLARPPVASNWACRPANPATKRPAAPRRGLSLNPAARKRGPDLTPRPFRASARGGLFACQSVPARTDRRERADV